MINRYQSKSINKLKIVFRRNQINKLKTVFRRNQINKLKTVIKLCLIYHKNMIHIEFQVKITKKN